MTQLPFSHPLALVPTAVLMLAALFFALRAHLRPGLGVKVVGQHPLRLGLGMALVLAGLGLGLAGPRWGLPEVPRLTVHVVLDASRSMQVPDCHGRSRWTAACSALDKLWSQHQSGLRYSLDLITGDTIPMVPPGEDLGLLRDSLRAVQPGQIGSPGTSLGRGLPQVAAQAEPRTPAIILLLSDGDETWEAAPEAQARALEALKKAKLPLYALSFGEATPSQVPADPSTNMEESPREPSTSAANPELLKALAEGSGGRLVASPGELPALLQRIAHGNLPMPAARSTLPAHPEVGAWLAILGLALWLSAAGKPMASWRLSLGLLLLCAAAPARAQVPLPESVKAWLAQRALDQGDLEGARKWRPGNHNPKHRLLAALIDLKSSDPRRALETLAPLAGQGAPKPLPQWRAPALLLAARAQVAMDKPQEAIALLERLLKEEPGRPEAVHDLQTLVKDSNPPPPNPRKPPPPPPPRPSQGARQDEIEGIQQRMPQKPKPQGGVKDT